jgi:hypothetical protein
MTPLANHQIRSITRGAYRSFTSLTPQYPVYLLETFLDLCLRASGTGSIEGFSGHPVREVLLFDHTTLVVVGVAIPVPMAQLGSAGIGG